MAVGEGEGCRETQRASQDNCSPPVPTPSSDPAAIRNPHPVFVGRMRQGGLRGCGSQEDLPRPLVVRVQLMKLWKSTHVPGDQGPKETGKSGRHYR